jgi:ribosomal protein L11 methyltransferase
MAFGTGTHATTRLCLDLLDQVLHTNQSLLDVGTGSGILAIAAAKLGAAPILAIDNDATAVESAQRNADLNAVHESMTVRQGSAQDVAGDQKWDIVVANILAPIIEQLLREERLGACVAEDGLLILSGILAVQQAQMEAVLQEAGFRPNRILNEGDWIAILAQRVG